MNTLLKKKLKKKKKKKWSNIQKGIQKWRKVLLVFFGYSLLYELTIQDQGKTKVYCQVWKERRSSVQ